MSDDTTLAFTTRDSFPLDAAHQLEALREQNDRLAKLCEVKERRIIELGARITQLTDLVDAARPVLRTIGPAVSHLVERINDAIGQDRLSQFVEQYNSGAVAPVQGCE